MPVLCEVEAGIQGVRDQVQYRDHLNRLLRSVRIWPFDAAAAREYGIIATELRQRGFVLSQIDMMIAALARQMRLVLVTSDKDFEGLPDIPREKWTT
jgi:tRNA(fMet)-specific endonuclease VapC